MKTHQRIAFDQPCFVAEQTITQAWQTRLPAPNDNVTARMTLNVGLE